VIVKATNEGRALVDAAPKDPVTKDFSDLADRLLGREVEVAAKSPVRLFGRQIAVRA